MTRHGKGSATQSAGEGSSSTARPDSVTIGTTQQSGESQEEENTFAGETVERIETLIESFRTGKSAKSETTSANSGPAIDHYIMVYSAVVP